VWSRARSDPAALQSALQRSLLRGFCLRLAERERVSGRDAVALPSYQTVFGAVPRRVHLAPECALAQIAAGAQAQLRFRPASGNDLARLLPSAILLLDAAPDRSDAEDLGAGEAGVVALEACAVDAHLVREVLAGLLERAVPEEEEARRMWSQVPVGSERDAAVRRAHADLADGRVPAQPVLHLDASRDVAVSARHMHDPALVARPAIDALLPLPSAAPPTSGANRGLERAAARAAAALAGHGPSAGTLAATAAGGSVPALAAAVGGSGPASAHLFSSHHPAQRPTRRVLLPSRDGDDDEEDLGPVVRVGQTKPARGPLLRE
jgi:hypothetical protein